MNVHDVYGLTLKILPVILTFFSGIAIRKAGVVKNSDGDLLIKIVFWISLPALVILTVSEIKFTYRLAMLPAAAAATAFFSWAAVYAGKLLFRTSRAETGTALTGAMIMNLGFILPFVIAVYGNEGFARAVIFDFGNVVCAFTVVYYIACLHGTRRDGGMPALKMVCTSPPLIGLSIAIFLNVSGLGIPLPVKGFLKSVGDMTLPLIMLALGIYFSPRLVNPSWLFYTVFVRMAGGLLFGIALSRLLGLEGLNRNILIICAAAPTGFNTITFSAEAGLDTRFAASLVSVSVAIGLIFTPVLILFLGG